MLRAALYRSIRHATLSCSFVVFAGSAAFAGIPDPACSQVDVIKVVGYVSGAPDADEIAFTTGVIRDPFACARVAHARVWIDVSSCCDIVLCNVDGQSATRTGDFFTDANGNFRLRVIGASKDVSASLYGTGSSPNGCGMTGAHVWANFGTGDIDLGPKLTVAYDLNGAVNSGSNGMNSLDVSIEIQDVGLCLLNSIYVGRLDQTCGFKTVPDCGQITGGDIAFQSATAGRLLSAGTPQGCPGFAYFQKDCGP